MLRDCVTEACLSCAPHGLNIEWFSPTHARALCKYSAWTALSPVLKGLFWLPQILLARQITPPGPFPYVLELTGRVCGITDAKICTVCS